MMGILLAIARVFVNTFGITEPTHESERRAAYYIGALIALIIIGMVASLALFMPRRH